MKRLANIDYDFRKEVNKKFNNPFVQVNYEELSDDIVVTFHIDLNKYKDITLDNCPNIPFVDLDIDIYVDIKDYSISLEEQLMHIGEYYGYDLTAANIQDNKIIFTFKK